MTEVRKRTLDVLIHYLQIGIDVLFYLASSTPDCSGFCHLLSGLCHLHRKIFTKVHLTGNFTLNYIIGNTASQNLTRIHDVGKIADL